MKLDRRVKWQLKKVAEGKCPNCGKAKGKKYYCDPCGAKKNKLHMARYYKLKQTCCICGLQFEGFGNNAQPLFDGRCCTKCDNEQVTPYRIKLILNK